MEGIIKKIIVTAVSLIMLFSGNCKAQTFPKPPEPWREEYNITLDSFQFSHPMTVINQADLLIVKQRIQENTEPQISAFQHLLTEAEVQLDFVPDAPVEMDIMGGYEPNSNLSEMRDWLWRNCHAAYTCALAYAYSNDSRYADKARDVIMNWASTYTTFTGGDRGLQLGSWFSPMLYASDLIWDYAAFTAGDKDRLKKWIRIKWLDEGDVLDESMQIWIRDNRPLRAREGDEWSTLNKGSTIPSSLDDFHYRANTAGFSLDQNYPNPFNEVTEITFCIPEKNHTTLGIYNSTGKLLHEVLDYGLEPGTHRITFNAACLAPGLYFYRLNSGSLSVGRKMMIIR